MQTIRRMEIVLDTEYKVECDSQISYTPTGHLEPLINWYTHRARTSVAFATCATARRQFMWALKPALPVTTTGLQLTAATVLPMCAGTLLKWSLLSWWARRLAAQRAREAPCIFITKMPSFGAELVRASHVASRSCKSQSASFALKFTLAHARCRNCWRSGARGRWQRFRKHVQGTQRRRVNNKSHLTVTRDCLSCSLFLGRTFMADSVLLVTQSPVLNARSNAWLPRT